MDHNKYSLFDSTASFEDSKVILVGDIHKTTTKRMKDILYRLRHQTGGCILLEGISFEENMPDCSEAVFGAEDMALFTQAGEIWEDIKGRLRCNLDNREYQKVYPDLKRLVDEMLIVDSKREEHYVYAIEYAARKIEGKVYFESGIAHIREGIILDMLRNENLSYSAYLPFLEGDDKVTTSKYLDLTRELSEELLRRELESNKQKKP